MRRGLTITAAAAVLSVCGVIPASASSTWTLEPTPTPAQGVDGQLLAVSCLTANDCTAVGGYTSTAGPVPLAERWDGSTWSIQTTPVPTGANFSILDGVSCTSATNCMAVGSYETPGSNSLPLAEHWDGSSWSIQAMPVPAGGFGFQVKAVSCPTAASCTAVGQYQTGTVPLSLGEGWNGSTWTVQTMPSPSHVADLVVLEGVSCTAPGTCTTAGWFQRGGTRVFVTLADKFFNGAWKVSSTRGPSAILGQLYGVSCTAADQLHRSGEQQQRAAGGALLPQHVGGPGDSQPRCGHLVRSLVCLGGHLHRGRGIRTGCAVRKQRFGAGRALLRRHLAPQGHRQPCVRAGAGRCLVRLGDRLHRCWFPPGNLHHWQ